MKKLITLMLALAMTAGVSAQRKAESDVAIKNIMTRTSVRKYTNETVTKSDIETMLRAGMAAPTAVNKQPWHFVVIDNTKSASDIVRKYALNAKEAGLDGVVCSALEASIIKEIGFMSVTPGIRLAGDSKDDQKRVATPAYAKELGASYIVVGRSITKAEDPVAAYKRCVKEFVE